MGNQIGLHSLEDLPSHLILEILTCGRLSSGDLACLELTSRLFGGSHEFMYPHKFRSLVDFAAFQLCISHPVYAQKVENSQRELFDRCSGNWKRVLRFLQAVEQCSNAVETSAGKIATGRYHTLLIRNSSVYSCGSSLCGVLGCGSEQHNASHSLVLIFHLLSMWFKYQHPIIMLLLSCNRERVCLFIAEVALLAGSVRNAYHT